MKYIFSIAILSIVLSGCTISSPTSMNADRVDEVNVNINSNNSELDSPVATKNTLDLSGQGLREVSQSVFKQTNLEQLDVSDNNLTGALPGEIRHLQKLKVLRVANNQMTGVPAEIGQLVNLEILDLSNNQLTGLPYELGNLKNLKTLNLSGNQASPHDLDIIRQSLPAEVNIIQ